jgi:hypothetical protein
MPKRSVHHYIVYISDEDCYGVTESMGAFASLVKYNKQGIEYKVMMLNEDLIFIEDINIGIEEEEI